MVSIFNKMNSMIQKDLLHEAQKLSNSLNKRQSSNELRVICKIAGQQLLNGHQCGSIMVHQNWSQKGETTILKRIIMKG
jgi:hypothetical protein